MSHPVTAPFEETGPSLFDCVICTERWPDHLMVQHGESHICCPCHGKMKDEAFMRMNQHLLSRSRIGNSKGPMLSMVGWLLLTALVLAGGGYGVYYFITNRAKPAALVETAPPCKDIGAFLMTGKLTPAPGAAPVSDTGFLLNGPEGTYAVVPATARALGTTPYTRSSVLFEKWEFSSGDANESPEPPVRATRLHGSLNSYSRAGIWLLELNREDVARERQKPLNVLAPQPKNTKVGTALWALRPAPAGAKKSYLSAQATVEHTFVGGQWFSIQFSQPQLPADLIGAPLVNNVGQLVGVVDAVAEKPSAEGRVMRVSAVGGLDLLGLQPPPEPKPGAASTASGEGSPAPATRKKSAINPLSGSNPYDKPEYKELQ